MTVMAIDSIIPEYDDGKTVRRIAICIPHRDTVTAEWAFAWDDMVKPPNYRLFRNVVPVIDIARDSLVMMALQSCATDIVFIDSDVIPDDRNAIMRLIANPAPIISGVYWARKGGPVSTPAMWTKVPWPNMNYFYPIIDERMAPMEPADVVGAGLCRIKADIFHALRPPWFFWSKDRYHGWEPMAGGSSEDFNLFMRCKKELNVGVMVDTTMTARHVTTAQIVNGKMGILGDTGEPQ